MRKLPVLVLVILPMILVGVTRTVSLDGSQQFTSIQTAINACSNGDIVLVYPGRYIENINLNGHSITLASLYSQNLQQAYIDSTIIDGYLGVCIKIESGEIATINGFTIVNNEQNQNPGFISGIGGGGGIRVKSSTALIKNCIIRNCIAYYGAGISVSSNANATLENNRIYQNRALCLGGGLLFSNGNSLTFSNNYLNSIYDNSAAAGMDIYIGWMDDYPNTTNIILDIGSRVITEPDNYFVNVAQASVTVNIAQSYFPALDNDVYVNPSGSDSNDGITSLTPFKTIKHALQLIKSNSDNPRTVHLSSGTYGFSFNGELLPLSLKPHVRIVGSGTDQTIINGELNNTFFAGWNMDDILIADMSFVNGRSTNTHPVEIIDCSTIEFRNLVFSNNHGYLTSGLHLLRSNNIILENLNIGNTAVANINPTVFTSSCENVYLNNIISHDNRITNNQDNYVGLFFNESNICLRNTIICNNSAIDAFLLQYQNVYPENANRNLDMSNVLIYNNSITNCNWAFAPVYLQNRYQSMRINNCTFAGNQGNGYFSAIFAYADIANVISYNPQFTSEMYLRNHVWNVHTGQCVDAEVNVRNSLFRTGSIPADLPNLVTLTDNIMNGNPLFLGSVTDTLSVTQPEYYYLSAGSPCINTGTADTTGMNLPIMDLAGNHRIWDGRIDMGCYEFGSTPVSIINPEYPPLPDKIVMSIYPNPVYISGNKGAYAFIEFTLPNKAKEPPLVEIFNIKGQKVKSMRLIESYNSMVHKAGLSNQVKQNGEFYSTIWNCRNDNNQSLSSGTYIVRVSVDGLTASKKIMIIK